MIGKLKGIVDTVGDGFLIIDVAGVGYYVFASSKTCAQTAAGEAVEFLIETHVREDHIHLYGFANAGEKDWFNLLLNVQGVGTKVALAILSLHSPQDLVAAIASQDKTAFARVSGIGPKLAQRIVTELKDKVAKLPSEFTPNNDVNIAAISSDESTIANDAVSALVNLGIARMDAFVVVNKIANDDMKLEDIITEALKEVAS